MSTRDTTHDTPQATHQATRRRWIVSTTAGAWGLLQGLPSWAANDARASSLPAAIQPEQLRLGFQKSSVNLVLLKQQGVLEALLPRTKVQWIEFPAGPQILEALSVGSVDIGFTGDSPPVFAQSAGKSLLYIGAELPKPQSSAILVPKGSNIQSLKDLKGRKVAFQRGSSAHYLVLSALRSAGLSATDIQPAYLTPSEARAAFERGSVDAWGIWDPFYAAAEVDAQPRVLSDGKGLSDNNSFYLAHPDWAARNHAFVPHFLQALSDVDLWLQSHRIEGGKQLAQFSGLGLATVLRFLDRRPRTPTRPLWPEVIAEQQKVAAAFFEQGLIPKAVRVADVVWAPKRPAR